MLRGFSTPVISGGDQRGTEDASMNNPGTVLDRVKRKRMRVVEILTLLEQHLPKTSGNLWLKRKQVLATKLANGTLFAGIHYSWAWVDRLLGL